MKLKAGLRFDWYALVEHEVIDQCCAGVVQALETSRHDKARQGLSVKQHQDRNSKDEHIARTLLSALFTATTNALSPEHASVSIPLTASHYNQKDPSKIQLSYRAVKAVYDTLKDDLGWISSSIGSELGGYTRISAHGVLFDRFMAVGCLWNIQDAEQITDLIVLRDKDPDNSKSKKKIDLPTPDTVNVSKYRAALSRFNDFISLQCICFDLTDDQLLQVNTAIYMNPAKSASDVNLSRRRLRRIFSRGDMNKGGRFYGGWWQSIPGIYRPHIAINGEKTIEVDYSAIAWRIMYDEAGQKLDGDDDPYDVGLTDWQGKTDPRRGLLKKFMNAMINAEEGKYRLKPYEQNLVGIPHKKLVDLVLTKHHRIRDYIADGNGLSAQFIDSKIAEAVMLGMMNDGIPVLPIHDSFIVSAKYESELKTAMRLSFDIYSGVGSGVTVDQPRNSEHFGLTKVEFNEHLKLYPVDLTQTEVVGIDNPKNSRMNTYYWSWLEQNQEEQ